MALVPITDQEIAREFAVFFIRELTILQQPAILLLLLRMERFLTLWQEGIQNPSWVIKIAGSHGTFGYRHIFSNVIDPVRQNFFSFGTGLSPYYAYEQVQIRNISGATFPAIIFWPSLADMNNNIADKILSPEAGVPGEALIGGNWVIISDSNGSILVSRNTVLQDEVIAPAGNSGNVGAHLHLELNYNFSAREGDNPLRYVQRPNPSFSNYQVLANHDGGIIIRRADLITESLSARVNSGQINPPYSGLDLDEVKFYLYTKSYLEDINFDPDFNDFSYLIWEVINYPSGSTPHSAQFLFSVKEAETVTFPPRIKMRRSSGTRVVPRGNTPGLDDFYYVSWNSKIDMTFTQEVVKDKDAQYRDGYNYFYAVADNTRSDFEDPSFFDFQLLTLDNFVPYVSRVRIYQGNCELRYDTDPEVPVSLPLLQGLATIVLTFSETICDNDVECAAQALPKAEIVGIVDPVEGTFGMEEVTNDSWTAQIEIPPGLSGEAPLRISDLYDTVGNPQAVSETEALEATFDPGTDQWIYESGPQEFVVSFESTFMMQTTEQTWARTYDINTSDYSNSIKRTSDGGYIVVGETGTISDVWVVKVDSSGVVEWEKSFGAGTDSYDYGHGVIQTSEGGYFVLASSRGLNQDPVEQFWLLELDGSGNIVWQRIYGPWGLVGFPDTDDTVQQTLDGGYIVGGFAGYAFSEDSYGDALIMKLDSSGNIEWRNVYGWDVDLKEEAINSIRQTVDGGYIACGYTSSLSGTHFNIWVLKLNGSGGVEWQYIYDDGDQLADWATSVDQTLDGGYVISGTVMDQWGDGVPLVLKLNSGGGIEWQRSYERNYDGFLVIRSTPDGGSIVAGSTNCDTTCNIWVLKLDNVGEIVWQKTYGAIGSVAVSMDFIPDGYAIAAEAYGDFFAFTLDESGNSCAFISDTSITTGNSGLSAAASGGNTAGYGSTSPSTEIEEIATSSSQLDQCGMGCSALAGLKPKSGDRQDEVKKRKTSEEESAFLRNLLRPPVRVFSPRHKESSDNKLSLPQKIQK